MIWPEVKVDREVGTGSDLEVSSSGSRASGFQVVNGKEKILQQFRDSTHLHGSLPWQERDRYISGLFHLLQGSFLDYSRIFSASMEVS